MAKKGKVLAVVGAQYGSEAKGSIVAKIAHRYGIHVRTGGVNAGHTIYHNGEKIVMQTVPCGWVYPDALLVIGRGALVDLEQLQSEIRILASIDGTIPARLYIDAGARVISSWHKEEEGFIHGEMHERIGSTGKGVGAARRDRVMRDPKKSISIGEALLDVSIDSPLHPRMLMEDTATWLNKEINAGENVLLEGTQGFGLDLLHGSWPYVTSNGCGTAQLLADAGIAPNLLTDTLLVARTFPIRVAGNSGPMHMEMTWDDISEMVGRKVTEQTTVTKKTRRVGQWDDNLFRRSVDLNGAKYVAITFMDYLSPEDEGETEWLGLSSKAADFVEYVEVAFGVKVSHVSTGWNEELQDMAIIERVEV